MTKTELAWVAGLLEGEGCFSKKSNKGTARNVIVSCQMTDPDVLRRLHRLAGGTFHGPYPNGPRGRLPRYTWRVHGETARSLMADLLPLMGLRRSARIRELIKAFDAVPLRFFKLLHVATGRVVVVRNLESWLDKHGMHQSNLWRTLDGQRSHHKGWRRLR